MTLEDILQKHFGLKGNLYLKKPKVIGYYCDNEKEYQYMTDKGARAYVKFIECLEDLIKFELIDDNVDFEYLDELTRGEY